MGTISVDMINNRIASAWWKELVKHFVRAGDELELRCWKEERDEIQQASRYGDPVEDHYEVSVRGVVCQEFLSELLSEDPADKNIYNKMTKYFTINVGHEQRRVCSAHYGTELYFLGVSDEDIAVFNQVMREYSEEDFSIHIER